MYYQTAFKIAAALLTSAKLASRYEGVHPRKTTELVDATQQEALTPTSRAYRRSEARPNFTKWHVAFEKNLVVIKFDTTTIKMHYGDVYKLYVQVRLAAKNAKAWAGDSSRQWTTHAVLSDAADNDTFTYVQ